VRVDGRSEIEPDEVEWLDLGPADRPASGADPRGPGRRGWYALGAVVVAAAALVVVVRHRGSHPTAAAKHPPTPSASVSVVRPASAQPPPVLVTDLGHPLLDVPSDWQLIARGVGVLVRIELAQGRIIRTSVPAVATGGPISVVPGPDRVIVQPLDAVPGYEVRDGRPGQALPAAFGTNGLAYPGPDPAHLWLPGADNRHMVLFGFDGRRAGPALSIPVRSPAVASDASGYLLFYGTGGVYDAQPGGIRRITTGELVAAGPTRWLTDECDQHFRCSTVVIDRRTGARRTLSGHIGANGGLGVISPDGSVAALFALDSGTAPNLRLLDLATGVSHATDVSFDPDDAFESGSFVWSPDSRWLFAAGADGRIAVIDRTTMRSTALAARLPAVSQVALRTGAG
jgi:hypothetical protein